MKLVVLGSGTSVPHARRTASAFWFETPHGTLLLDAGADAAHRCAQEALAWTELDAIWISHFPLDHIGGLAPFLFGTKYAPATQTRRKPLTITGPVGLKRVLDGFDAANNYKLLEQPFPVHVREVAPEASFEILPRVEATTLSTPHTEESLALGLRVVTEEGTATLCYTSDTGVSDALVGFARDADLLIVEASFIEAKPVETHLNLREAIHVAQASQARRSIFTHLYPEWDGTDLRLEARKLWDGEIHEAQDGLRLDLTAHRH